MRNRDYMRYLERLKRDMEILKNSSDISRLTRKINRLEHEIDIEHSTDSDEILPSQKGSLGRNCFARYNAKGMR